MVPGTALVQISHEEGKKNHLITQIIGERRMCMQFLAKQRPCHTIETVIVSHCVTALTQHSAKGVVCLRVYVGANVGVTGDSGTFHTVTEGQEEIKPYRGGHVCCVCAAVEWGEVLSKNSSEIVCSADKKG